MRIAFLLHNAYAMGGTVRTAMTLADTLAGRHQVELVSVFRHREKPRFARSPEVPLRALVDRRKGSPDAADPLARRAGEAFPNSPSGSAQGAGLDQSSDTDSDNQWWKLVPATSGYYRLVNVGNGWCADVKDASTADGAAIIQWPNTGGTNQEWQVIAL